MGKEITLKVARTTQSEIQAVLEFLRDLSEIMDTGTLYNQDDDSEREITTSQDLDDWLHERWPAIESVWSRVMLNCSTLYKNCCDHDSDTLEWRKDIRELMLAAGYEET